MHFPTDVVPIGVIAERLIDKDREGFDRLRGEMIGARERELLFLSASVLGD